MESPSAGASRARPIPRARLPLRITLRFAALPSFIAGAALIVVGGSTESASSKLLYELGWWLIAGFFALRAWAEAEDARERRWRAPAAMVRLVLFAACAISIATFTTTVRAS